MPVTVKQLQLVSLTLGTVHQVLRVIVFLWQTFTDPKQQFRKENKKYILTLHSVMTSVLDHEIVYFIDLVAFQFVTDFQDAFL